MRLAPVVVAPVVVAAFALAACTSSTGEKSAAPNSPTNPTRSTSAPASSTPPPTTSAPSTKSSSPAPRSAAQKVFDRMTEGERVGQLLMVDCSTTGVSAATTTAITQYHVGSVILDVTSYAGMQTTQGVTQRLRGLAPKGVGLFISTDQEGGQVQRLQGPGFDRIPSGVNQGQLDPSSLQRQAQQWGGQLNEAGVNVNLAPVLDTVPANSGPNPPIGHYDRQYGDTPQAVQAHGLAFAQGMTAAGIDVTVKHFPGLGRVAGNTDTTSGVTDTVTTRDDPYLAPFRAAIKAHVPFVMMSTAIYSRIDPNHPAAFSKTIVTGLLRHDLGFTGLIISDDVGGAKQVSFLTPGQRAVDFIAAGGDVVLTIDANQAAEMTGALLQKAGQSAAFKKKVDAAALLVLQEKQRKGLLG